MRKLFFLVAAIPFVAMAQTPVNYEVALKDVMPKVIEWRRDLHQNPELSNREFKTQEKIVAHLQGLGIEEIT